MPQDLPASTNYYTAFPAAFSGFIEFSGGRRAKPQASHDVPIDCEARLRFRKSVR
jgi:hypothetical protein